MLKLDIGCANVETVPLNSICNQGRKWSIIQLWEKGEKGVYLKMMPNQCITLWRKGKSFTGQSRKSSAWSN